MENSGYFASIKLRGSKLYQTTKRYESMEQLLAAMSTNPQLLCGASVTFHYEEHGRITTPPRTV